MLPESAINALFVFMFFVGGPILFMMWNSYQETQRAKIRATQQTEKPIQYKDIVESLEESEGDANKFVVLMQAKGYKVAMPTKKK